MEQVATGSRTRDVSEKGSYIMGKPKKVEPPPAPAPIATEVQAEEAGEEEVRKQRRRSGRRKTVLTGALAPSVQGKTTLG